ncbi:MAG: NUDIX domain-containing protein [Nanoarchaeota archaeon]|nr:NUDIX domain-containing protein [Nanoarchaeota archaeon]MBU4117007.1 NUDIX domain-containing protein [Nanoarchaeota archaeon]
MQKKILTFIANNGKLLVLYSEPHPEHGEGGWFLVTGGIEKDETYEEAVIREVLEETGLVTEEVISLNWGSIYNWRDEICEEHNFISFVKPGEIILNEEHSKYDWLDIEEFIQRIRWDDDKDLLKTVLENALNKEKYFDKITLKDYRECKNE